IGAGIFSTIGNAASAGGPAVSLLFIFTAVACAFSALCYAEFASMIPVSGSAYTYSYVAFGEIIAWIIGWDLILEYAVGNIAVAISWSDYFTGLMDGLGMHIPEYLTMDFLSAMRGSEQVEALLAKGVSYADIPGNLILAHKAWQLAPQIGNFHFVADVPALAIVFFITYLVYIGIKKSRNVSNILVVLKLLVIVMVIVVGFFYINPANWNPFAPNGISGILKGVAAVFFAYIGFDAISTTAEETKNPQRDLPRAIIFSLVICTVLYVLISLTLTGMVPYINLAVGDPLAFVFKEVGLHWVSGVVAVSAVIAMASVLLVFQMGQPRILMSMSRDGLLPKKFSTIHPKFSTPSFATIVTGFVVAIPALFMNLTELTDLTSIGTLFAFVLVCGGVLVLQNDPSAANRKFRVPYINGKYIVPALFVITISLMVYIYKGSVPEMLGFYNVPAETPVWDVMKHKIPHILFFIISIYISIVSYRKNLSLIPVLGLLSCFYLMTELGYLNWVRFIAWLLIGLVIYFLFSYSNSKLRHTSKL
ncbi:MAG: amino acid permease, partial [Bacteroidia bacterium]